MRDVAPLAWYAARGINTMPTGGGPVERFERRFAGAPARAYALLMNSGTAALHSAFFAVGVKPGDEVIVPPYTFFASAGPLLHLGGVPVFCDLDERTLTADPDDVEARITPRTKAICVVHVWGNPARMDRFVDIARRHGVALIEDCSHAHGATYGGRPVGTWGDIGCFSLQGNKPVSGGEAGIAITEDAALFDRMLALAHTGRTGRQQAAATFAIDDLSFGLKYRPHLAAAQWALSAACAAWTSSTPAAPATTPCWPTPCRDEGRDADRDVSRTPSVAATSSSSSATTPTTPAGGRSARSSTRPAPRACRSPSTATPARARGRRCSTMRRCSRRRLRRARRLPRRTDGGRPVDGPGAPGRSPRRSNDRLITLPPFTEVSEAFVRQCGAALSQGRRGSRPHSRSSNWALTIEPPTPPPPTSCPSPDPRPARHRCPRGRACDL